jgi:hypothetical protein
MGSRSWLAPRGVRVADYTIDGCQVLEAISSAGECIARLPVASDALEEVVREWLWGYLEGYDPPLRLSA